MHHNANLAEIFEFYGTDKVEYALAYDISLKPSVMKSLKCLRLESGH